jgi:hypothetical protein
LAGGLFVVAEIEPPTVCPPASCTQNDSSCSTVQGGGKRRVVIRRACRGCLRAEESAAKLVHRTTSFRSVPVGLTPSFWRSLRDPHRRDTRNEAPDHRSHAGPEHRRCFNDDDTDRRPPGIAKSQ